MIQSPITLSRRHVLGDLYDRCLAIVNVPVYLDTQDTETIGYADEGLGVYADAFRFYLSDELCKKLASGHFTYSFDYDFADDDVGVSRNIRRIRLNSITLNSRKGYAKPEPKTKLTAAEKLRRSLPIN